MQYLYRHYNSNDELLYVGISLNAIVRLGQHEKNAGWYSTIAKITMETYNTREEVLKAEKHAIITEKPLFNITHTKKTFDESMIEKRWTAIEFLPGGCIDMLRLCKIEGITYRVMELTEGKITYQRLH